MWKPIINEQKEQIYIRSKIDDIYKALIKTKINEFDLYFGKSGICLFLAYYYNINKKCRNDIDRIIESLIINATQYKITDYVHFTHYSEIAWFMCHLYEKKLINIDIDDYFSDIDESLYEVMIIYLKGNEHGCLNGAISIGLYFYYRYILGSIKCKYYLELFVDFLKETAIEKDNTMKWITMIDQETHEQGCNLGIAHGIPGILLFLRKLYLNNIKRDLISDMIIKAANFLLLQKKSLKKHKSFFSYSVSADSSGYDTKLGWCYGDMSVGYSLLMISSLDGIERKDIKENALEILVSTTERTNLSDLRIVDAGLCHGTSGIAHIYNRLYHQTNELKFRNAALFWYDETLKMAKYDDRYAGYKLPHSEKENLKLENSSFLTGISGTGLSLLSAIYPMDPSWDMSLLLS